jgi:MoaA/NifB/PqqE/SkfB family radical SAM enzyme
MVRRFKRSRLESKLAAATGEDIKFANAELNWREYWHGMTALQSRPRFLQIGTNWTCNLRCNFCRLTLDSTQKVLKGKPPRELEISPRVLDNVLQLMPYAEMMNLTPLGEPMLYSKFGLILEKHRQLGCKNLSMTTNANLITDERARMLVESGIHHMFVSVDSSDSDVYAGMRVRGDLAKVEAALEAINRWKEKLRSKTPYLTLASTFMERNVRQMPDLLDFAVRHGFITYSIQLMETENVELEGEFLGYHLDLTKEMLLETVRRASTSPIDVRATIAFRNLLSKHLTPAEYKAVTSISEGMSGEKAQQDPATAVAGKTFLESTKGTTLLKKCHYPWYYLLIDTDGDARPCCWTGMTFGNLNELDYQQIWNGSVAKQMRQDFLNNHIPKGCQAKHCRVDLDHFGTME